MTDRLDASDDAFRDYVTAGLPASGDNEPDKADIRAAFAEYDSAITVLESLTGAGYLGRATYAALAALTPSANTIGVVPPSDTGTHTDPVVGGTVSNNGLFRYSTSPAGWERIYAYPPNAVATVAELAAGTGGNLLTVAANLKTHLDNRAQTVLEAQAKFEFQLREATPTSVYPVVAIKAGVRRILVRLPLKYGSGVVVQNGDFAEFELQDMGPYQTPTMARGWALVSVRSCIKGKYNRMAQFSFESISGGNSNTGRVPSTFEFAFQLGQNGDTVNDTNYPYVGFGHGHMAYVSSHIYLDGAGSDLDIDTNFPVGTVVYGDTFSVQQEFNLLTPAGGICTRTTLTHSFLADNSNGQCRIEHTHDPAHAVVNTTGAIRTGYVGMLPTTFADYAKATGQTAVDMLADADGNYQWGKSMLLANYHSAAPTHLVELVMAFSYNMRVDGVDNDWGYCDPSQYVTTLRNSEYGLKNYVSGFSQPGGTTDVDVIPGLLSCQNFIRVREAAAA